MRQEKLQDRLVDAFRRRFGRAPELAAHAPGRVNLIGEHTDYNGGLVMPCAIDRSTWALGARRADDAVHVRAADLAEDARFDSAQLERCGRWIDYVQGVVFALRERGLDPDGLDLLIASEVPQGAGLSSSAALTVSLATLWDGLAGYGLDAEARARVAHRAEHGFVGVRCGILDPFAVALGRRDHALQIDCRSEQSRLIPMPRDRVALLVAHSGVTRSLVDGSYGDRVAECAAGLAAVVDAKLAPADASSLRDLEDVPLEALERVLEPRLQRRVRHVLSENRRVVEFSECLQRGDLPAAGAVLRDGQRSLRDDYEVSVPELDTLCEIADGIEGVYGSRLTGAGFGGCTLHLVDRGVAERAAAELARAFQARCGRLPPVLEMHAADGASVHPGG